MTIWEVTIDDSRYPYYSSVYNPGIAKAVRGDPIPEPLSALGRLAEGSEEMTVFQITAEEAGRMVDYLDRQFIELKTKQMAIDAEISLNRDLRDRYRNLWLSLEKEEKAAKK